jgi:hypothetical protein
MSEPQGKIHFRVRGVLILALGFLILTSLVLQSLVHDQFVATTSTTTATHVGTTTTTRAIVASATQLAHVDRACGFSRHGFVSLNSSLTVTSIGVCRILVVGDSLAQDLEVGLINELPKSTGIRIVATAKVSTGLTTPWYYDWPHHLQVQVRRYHPDVVIALFGANDEHRLDVNGRAYPIGSKPWGETYRRRVRHMAAIATTSGAYVVWAGLPVVQDPRYGRGLGVIDQIVQAVAASTRGVSFFHERSLLASTDGTFRTFAFVNHHSEVIRTPDGLHFTTPGAEVLATDVIKKMSLLFRVNVRPSRPAIITQ